MNILLYTRDDNPCICMTLEVKGQFRLQEEMLYCGFCLYFIDFY